MRGKDFPFFPFVKLVRITPAYAGKRAASTQCHNLNKDHPCVCGEKLNQLTEVATREGSPLRMRGKVIIATYSDGTKGITPAYAGKRGRGLLLGIFSRDHPCVCGEKPTPGMPRAVITGSPLRMRGKVLKLLFCVFHCGITPAYAGKS